MLIYLDMCCLKRPFDDQSHPRIRLENEAVLALLALESQDVRFVRSAALVLENSFNPVNERASRVAKWLSDEPPAAVDLKSLEERTAALMALGFKNFDALHVATAEQAGADVLATCDDRLLSLASRNSNELGVRVASVVQLVQEMVK